MLCGPYFVEADMDPYVLIDLLMVVLIVALFVAGYAAAKMHG